MSAASPLDRRLHAARPDLADARLRGKVEASAFVTPTPWQVIAASAPLRREPRHDAGLDTEALCGERVDVFEIHEGWAWGQLATDGYVGYLPAERLGPAGPEATHAVASLRTFAYPGPSMKLPHVQPLSLGVRLAVVGERGDFAVCAGVGGLAEVFVWRAHLRRLAEPEADPVAVAEMLLGAPYLWGGRTSLGLDCSGLVSLAMEACGDRTLRDADMQEKSLGLALDDAAIAAGLRRGDLVFWKGHVGLMQDEARLIHANGHHMLVASETLDEASARILAKGGGPATSVIRR